MKSLHRTLRPLLAAALLASVGTAWAADKACVIEGSVTVAGKTTEVKDCMEFTTSVSADQLKSSCSGLAQMTAHMGGKAGKVTYLPQCPRPAKGACKGLMGQPLDAYYYLLSPQEIQEKRKACESSLPNMKAGTWSNGQ